MGLSRHMLLGAHNVVASPAHLCMPDAHLCVPDAWLHPSPHYL